MTGPLASLWRRVGSVLGAAFTASRWHRHPWQQALVALLLALPSLAWWFGPLPAWLAQGPAMQLLLVVTQGTLLYFMVWLPLCDSLCQQNHPSAARLVPGHVSALRLIAFCGWALCTALLAAVLQPWLSAWGWPRNVVLMLSGLLCAGLLWQRRWQWIGLALPPAMIGAVWAYQDLNQLAASLNPGGLWAATLLPLLGAGVTATPGAGSARHRINYGSRQAVRLAVRRLNTLGSEETPTHRDALALPRTAPVRGLVPGQSPTQQLAVLLQGASARSALKTALLTTAATTGVLALAILVLRERSRPGELQQMYRFMAGAMYMSMISLGGATLHTRLWNLRREQAVLALLPGVTPSVRLGAELFRWQLRLMAALAAPVATALLAFAWWWGDAQTVYAACTGLPLALWPWPDRLDRLRRGNSVRQVVPVIGLYAVFPVLALMPEAFTPWLASAGVLVSALMLAWKARRAAQPPHPLPVALANPA